MKVERIEVGLRRGVPDARGRETAERARTLGVPVRNCRTREVYKVAARMDRGQQHAMVKAFADPVIARAGRGRLRPPVFDWLIEVGFLPGVTDNVGRTAAALLADVLDRPLDDDEQVYTLQQYFIKGPKLTRADAWRLAREALANTLIHSVAVYAPDEWDAAPVDSTLPLMTGGARGQVDTCDLELSDEDLLAFSRERMLSLSLPELHAIRQYYAEPDRRAARAALGLPELPTDVEIECLAQTWSEHCSHKIFKARIRYRDEKGRETVIPSLFDTFIRGATREVGRHIDWLVSVFSDNAGIVRFNPELNVVYKVETHNSPSALDPYGGAITGIVGVNRDPMGTGIGAALLCNTWGYCLGSPFYDGDLPEGLFHPRRIRDGVHQGVIDGGNQSGIPYLRGFERFDDRYLGKPLVFCGTLGLLPANVGGRPSERKEILPGDLVVMAGGRIGKDGIHGATFSSEELRQESPAQAVQIGDPITQRKLYDFILEARDQGLYRALTDNGAGGLSSSVGEMARITGGAELDLDKAPLKYEGLAPWEILLSEAQERMTLAVPPEHAAALQALAERRDVELAVLGRFTDSGLLHLRFEGRTVGALDMRFLHDGCPLMDLEAQWKPPRVAKPRPARRGRRDRRLKQLLAALNICSHEYKARSYDHEVKGRSVIKPFVGVHADIPADAGVLLAEYDGRAGIVLAEGINPFYSDLDTYAMAAAVLDEAVRRIVASGGRLGTIAGLDNFCWPDPVQSPGTPDGHYKLAQLVRANQALYDMAVAYRVPLISGKDSMKNDSVRGGRKISIPPTLLFSALGRMDDVRRALTLAVQQPGDRLYLLGRTRDELGASAYHRLLAAEQGTPEHVGGNVPRVYPDEALPLYRALNDAQEQDLVVSAHTPTLGGLAVALAFCALAGDRGLDVDLAPVAETEDLSDDSLLFSESNSRFIVSVRPEHCAAFERCFDSLSFLPIGKVTRERRMTVRVSGGRLLVSAPLPDLRRAFKRTLEGI